MAKKIKNIYHYGRVEIQGTTNIRLLLSTSVTFEKDLGGEFANSKRLMFVTLKSSLLGVLLNSEKAVFYLDASLIANVENCANGNVELHCKNGDSIAISFKTEIDRRLFLNKLDEIQNDNSDLIKEIENEK